MHTAEPGTADAVLHGMMSIARMLKRGIAGDDRLEPGTFWLLRTIATHGPARVSEVAGHVGLDPSTVSRHVAQLERSGLIDRTPDPEDGRAHLIAASAEGQRRLDAAYERRREVLTRSLAGWDPRDVAEFERLLRQFVHSVETTTDQLEETHS